MFPRRDATVKCNGREFLDGTGRYELTVGEIVDEEQHTKTQQMPRVLAEFFLNQCIFVRTSASWVRPYLKKIQPSTIKRWRRTTSSSDCECVGGVGAQETLVVRQLASV